MADKSLNLEMADSIWLAREKGINARTKNGQNEGRTGRQKLELHGNNKPTSGFLDSTATVDMALREIPLLKF